MDIRAQATDTPLHISRGPTPLGAGASRPAVAEWQEPAPANKRPTNAALQTPPWRQCGGARLPTRGNG
eukprot:1473916-Lingulodinium_polyedra.AAC.1